VVELVRAWRRWRLPVAVGVAGIVALAALSYVLHDRSTPPLPPYGGPPPISDDRIEGADLIFSYTANSGNNNSSGYLTPPPECDECPFNDSPGAVWAFSFNLTNTDTASHEIEAISVVAPFFVESVSPTLPDRLAAGGSANFTITLTVPPSPGYYFLDGSIDAY
jgi:hypothetical protein